MDQSDGTREWSQPTAGIWACDNCGRRIQLLEDSDTPPVGPFICVCGAGMEQGEEHRTMGTASVATAGAGADPGEVAGPPIPGQAAP